MFFWLHSSVRNDNDLVLFWDMSDACHLPLVPLLCFLMRAQFCLALFQLDADVELNVPVQVLDDASAVPEEDGYGEL